MLAGPLCEPPATPTAISTHAKAAHHSRALLAILWHPFESRAVILARNHTAAIRSP